MEWCFLYSPWLRTLCVSIDWINSTVYCFEARRESSKALKTLSSDCERCMTQRCGAVFNSGTPQVAHAGQKVFVFICSSCFNICCLYWEQPHMVMPPWILVVAFLNLNNTETNRGLSISSYLRMCNGSWRVNSQWTQKRQTVWVLVCKTNFQCVAHRLSLIAVNK